MPFDAIEAELDRLRDDLVSDQELEDAKSYLTGVLPLALETHDGVAATLLAIEEFGLGLDYLDRYPDIIAGGEPRRRYGKPRSRISTPTRWPSASRDPLSREAPVTGRSTGVRLENGACPLRERLQIDQELVLSGPQHRLML